MKILKFFFSTHTSVRPSLSSCLFWSYFPLQKVIRGCLVLVGDTQGEESLPASSVSGCGLLTLAVSVGRACPPQSALSPQLLSRERTSVPGLLAITQPCVVRKGVEGASCFLNLAWFIEMMFEFQSH